MCYSVARERRLLYASNLSNVTGIYLTALICMLSMVQLFKTLIMFLAESILYFLTYGKDTEDVCANAVSCFLAKVLRGNVFVKGVAHPRLFSTAIDIKIIESVSANKQN